MPQTASDPFNMIPSDVNDDMKKLRDSIPPTDRCSACGGLGMMIDRHLSTYRICQQCEGSGRNNQAKKNSHG